jgi:hypothetical protein
MSNTDKLDYNDKKYLNIFYKYLLKTVIQVIQVIRNTFFALLVIFLNF